MRLVPIALLVFAGAASGQGPALRVCMNEDVPPYSVARGESGSGFDVALATALAKHLGRPLEIQWFESKIDDESSPTLEANALLSDRRCELMAGYPLTEQSLGRPAAKTARLPGFRGAGQNDRRRRVELGEVVPSRPYQRAPLALLLAPGVAKRSIANLGDVEDLRFGAEGGTLADAILMLYRKGKLIDRITHYPPGRGEVLKRLEAGEIDATFVSLHRFDAYRGANPATRIQYSGFNYPLAFNLGYAALSGNAALLGQVNAALESMRASGEVEKIARASGVTYVEPVQPFVSPPISFRQFEN
ncbi:MAG TPA: transporter substrate-binding domain-containing protein [Burkholderiales bacterium]|nr:transporter substrate-binding domain-containing protein [Burkholderiales bacterium]